MEIENILNLFDTYWFDLDFFKRKPSKITKKIPEMPPTNSEIIPCLPTIHTKNTHVEKNLSSSNNNNNNNNNNNSPSNKIDSSFSPISVLLSPKLQTIFSGKISEDFEDDLKSLEKQKSPQSATTTTKISTTSPLKGNSVISHNRRRKKKGLSKSLSDLEFEELKGFMDLGFVFSEEDVKDSSLATIIPGLQRLGNNNNSGNTINHSYNVSNKIIISNNVDESGVNNDNNKEKFEKSGGISRPYLSEAWEVMERKRGENELLKNRVPDLHSQVQMKDYLRCWAHTVASTVR